MSVQLKTQSTMLLPERLMSRLPAPFPYAFEGAAQSLPGCLPLYYPISPARFRPVMCEAEEVKALVFTRTLFPWPSKLYQPGLGRV